MTDSRPAAPAARVSSAVPVARREIFAWAMYDFANSSYTTTVLTAIFNAYFVGVVASRSAGESGAATLWWGMATGVANLLVLATAPVLGAIVDHGAHKKRLLAVTTVGCVVFTAALALVGSGDVLGASFLIIVSAFMFHTGEDVIAAFLPELARPRDMGRISGYGWSLGYFGGLFALGLSLAYVTWSQGRGLPATHYVPVTMLITAACFGLASLPTFLWLRERAAPQRLAPGESYVRMGFARVRDTLRHAHRYRDLFRFLLTLAVYYSGIYTVIVLAAVYAQQVMGFSTQDSIMLILVVNVTAAAGAFGFGFIQDRLGSVRTLMLTLALWTVALVYAFFIHTRAEFWIVANLIGIALGSSQSAGRALVGQFSPPERSAEFFGLWGLASKAASIVGPIFYGLVTWLSHNDHRLALLATTVFFVVGLVMMAGIDEQRGRDAAYMGR